MDDALIPFQGDREIVTSQPSFASPDYLTRLTFPCRLTYSDNTITSIYKGTGISPEQHPLSRQFEMLRFPLSGCGGCQSSAVSVIYARFTRPLADYDVGEILCIYEIFCPNCGVYTSRLYAL